MFPVILFCLLPFERWKINEIFIFLNKVTEEKGHTIIKYLTFYFQFFFMKTIRSKIKK